jgi:hypothetical protein
MRRSGRKLKREQVLSPQFLRIIDLARSIVRRWISIPLQTSISDLRRSGRKLKNERVESLQSLVAVDLQVRGTCQMISYLGRKELEAE